MNSTATSSDPFVRRLQTIQGLITAGKLQEAAQRLNAAQKNAPQDARVFLLGARLAETAKNPAGAEEAARRAMALAPDWVVAVTELAHLLARLNKFDEAISLARKAVSMEGKSPNVLDRVIDIAQRAQALDLSNQWLAVAESVAPSNLQIKRLRAENLRHMRKYKEAVDVYDDVLKTSANDVDALVGRLQCWNALGEAEAAQHDGNRLLTLAPNNEVAQFWASVAGGTTPATQPSALIRSLYDTTFAARYDQHVVATLKYQLPRQVAKEIRDRHPNLKLNVLDLGCGTGLLGACLGRIDGALVGVDISTAMIAQAMRHNVYDRFHTVNLLDALQATPGDLYDVITALDVFIYVGELKQAIVNAWRIIKPGGYFMFSCETASEDEAEMVLRPTQRYAHKPAHIQAVCVAAGFDSVLLESVRLRYEKNVPVEGFLVIAKKPT